MANPGNCWESQEVKAVSKVLNAAFILENRPEETAAGWSNVANVPGDAPGPPSGLTRCSAVSFYSNLLVKALKSRKAAPVWRPPLQLKIQR
jgi:hypothetical protein